MATLQAPTGAFLLLELESGLDPRHVAVLVHMFVSMAQVRACNDLALMPLELLAERILLRLTPEEQRLLEMPNGRPRARRVQRAASATAGKPTPEHPPEGSGAARSDVPHVQDRLVF